MSQIPPQFFFRLKNYFLFWKCRTKMTPRYTKILTSPVWNLILRIWDTCFELMQIETLCNKNYFKIFSYFKVEGLEKNIDLEQWKSRQPNINKKWYLICQPFNPYYSFFETCRDFVDTGPKFLTLEGETCIKYIYTSR